MRVPPIVMKNLLPGFIQEQLRGTDQTRGTFAAHSMFVDISGFTPMAEQLMREGKEGAEILSREINRLFAHLIESVHNHGGFITGFAGDAFTALFIAPSPLQAVEAAREIQEQLTRDGLARTRFGEFQLYVRVGLSSGLVQWGVVGRGTAPEIAESPALLAWYFRGPAIDGCALSEHHCERGEIVLDAAILAQFPESERPVVEPTDAPDFFGLAQIPAATRRGLAAALSFVTRLDQTETNTIRPEIAELFFPRSVLETTRAGEFRSIASVFVSFVAPEDHAALDAFATSVRDCAARYDGFFNNLDFGDKGGTILLVFGAPVSHEDDPGRAADCALELHGLFGEQIRIGLATGIAFAGIAGSELRCTYSVLGDVVNFSARLMTAAPPGEIWLSTRTQATLGGNYLCDSRGAHTFKGKSEAESIVALTGKGERDFAVFDQIEFVGRDAQTALVDARLDILRAGRPAGLVRILGEAGSGKSRLLHETYVRHNAGLDFIFVHADGILRRSLNPFVAYFTAHFAARDTDDRTARRGRVDARLDELIAELRSASEGDTGREHVARELDRTRSMFAAMVDADTTGTLYERLDARARYENTLSAIKYYFHARALMRPTVLVLENLQWLDSDSQTVLKDTLHHADAQNLAFMTLVSSRYHDDGGLPEIALDAAVPAHDVRLGALNVEAVSAISRARLAGPPASELLNFIEERTRGNPFYVEQFCAYLISNALVVPAESGELRLGGDVIDLPGSINALIVARIDRLSAVLKEAVLAAAVLGQEFEVGVLAHLRGVNVRDAELKKLLAAGQRERIWAPSDDGAEHSIGDESASNPDAAGVDAGRRIWTFENALLQEAAYEMQLRDRLRELHETAANFLVEWYGASQLHAADIAYHYGRAENQSQARRYYALAAEYAHANYKADQAFRYYDQWLARAADDAERLEIFMRRARLLELLGRWPEAATLLEDGLRLAAEDPTHARALGRLKTNLGEIYQKQGQSENAARILHEAIAVATAQNDLVGLGEAHDVLGRTYWSLGQYDNALTCYAEGKQAKQETGDRRGYALNLYYTGVVYRDRNEYEQAMRYYTESLEIFENELNDQRYATYPMYDIAVIYQYQGRLEQAREFFQKTHDRYEEIGYVSGISAALLNLGVIESRQGRYAAALEMYTASLEHARELGEQLAIAYALFSIGTAYYQLKNYEETTRYFEQSFVVMKSIAARGYYGYVLAYLTCTFARQGLTAKALNAGLQHLKNIRALGGSDVENGRTHLGIALALAGGKLSPKSRELIGTIGELTGLSPVPEAYFEFAVDTARKAGYVITLAPALREYGRYLAGRAERAPWFAERAMNCLNEALQLATQAGLAGERDRVLADAAEFQIELEQQSDGS